QRPLALRISALVRHRSALAPDQRHHRRRPAPGDAGADAGAIPCPGLHRRHRAGAERGSTMMATERNDIEKVLERRYDAGFVTEIETDSLPPGLDENTIRALSARKGEPAWMTDWRLAAYRRWLDMP